MQKKLPCLSGFTVYLVGEEQGREVITKAAKN